ncbi:HlyD family efflux transporter periplasmic adaptor subunit [Bacteroidia bacterium]|nr:HlyD family efflux transporter periplasmic adaptor subunit [Bacteroidia bacterium]MDB4107214.1 HlyD family efflux transporter periplasmic adaptor subunit [Bacteroidia bacterium]MDC1395587.1 HlyD family efflux transporter periplasmic adaptor subunit [Bacteroidia bacterium]
MSETSFNKNLGRSIILGAVTILIAFLINKKLSDSSSKVDPDISFSTKLVEAIPASPRQIPVKILVSGRLEATNRLELYAEVNGVLKTKNFREGQRYNSGQAIATMDDSELRSQLTAQRSSFLALVSQAMTDISLDYPNKHSAWNAFLQSINPSKNLPSLPALDNQQLKQFISGRNILTNYYNIQSQEVRLRKYRINAPYSGVLSETSINPGTLVRAGQKIGTFVQKGNYELEAPLSQNDLKYLKVGSKVKLKSSELDKEFVGTVSRINSIINPSTQLVSVFLKVNGKELKEGLYLNAVIDGGIASNAIVIDRNILIDGKAIYSISADSTLKVIPVEVMSFVEDKAIVSGITPGTLIPNKTISGAFDGMKIEPLLK